ncbi:MAG: hypothetical protein HY898_19805 [Deltaproteobacteria bacterium]|nr:hypothetical protein [Deltaproteobacteria bacterium]
MGWAVVGAAVCAPVACGGNVEVEPAPQLLLKLDSPHFLAFSGDNLIVASPSYGAAGLVYSVPRAGGEPKEIAQCACTGLAVNQSHIFWTTKGGPARKSNLDGSVIVSIKEVFDGYSPVVDETWLYWSELTKGRVLGMPVEGGTPLVLAENQYQPGNLVLTSTYVYWTNWADQGAVRRVNRNGGPVEQLADGLTSPGSLRIGAAYAYWRESPYYGLGKLMRAPLSGGGATLFAEVDNPFGLVIDDEFMYWTRGEPIKGAVMRVPLDGGTSSVVASNQDHPCTILMDSTHLYWSNCRGGTVMRKPKPQIH